MKDPPTSNQVKSIIYKAQSGTKCHTFNPRTCEE